MSDASISSNYIMNINTMLNSVKPLTEYCDAQRLKIFGELNEYTIREDWFEKKSTDYIPSDGEKNVYRIDGTSGSRTIPTLIYVDRTNSDEDYAVMILLHGGILTDSCCNTNPMTNCSCEIGILPDVCIYAITKNKTTGEKISANVPSSIADDAINAFTLPNKLEELMIGAAVVTVALVIAGVSMVILKKK
jgi:hypothetical protein